MFVNSVSNLVITDIVSANRLLNSPVGVTTYRRNRDRWALVLKAKGQTIYYSDDRQILSDANHPVLLPKGGNYSWNCIQPGACLIIEFEAVAEGSDICGFEIYDNSALIHAFQKIEKCLDLRAPDYKTESICCLYQAILALRKSRTKEYITRDRRQMLQPALDHIAQNYFDADITNDTLAECCAMSTVYFRKLFSMVYGTSPIKYLHDFRMKKAKDILQSDYNTIEQIAQSVGYNSLYHFSKMFKTYTGKSPTEYAKTIVK